MAEPTTPDGPTPGITITRVFDAPRECVWKEWTEPEPFADWFGGSDCEVPLATISMDVRPGGSRRAAMFCDAGRREIHWKGEYREVVEPERLVFTLSDEPGEEAYELISVVLTDLATAGPRCTSSSADSCRPRCTSAPQKGGRPSLTASRSAWPTPDPTLGGRLRGGGRR